MVVLLRILSLLVGCLLTLAPSFLMLQFAYGVGEPPTPEDSVTFFLPLLLVGLGFGLGPLLIGLPKLVAGPRTPVLRVITGILLGVSACGFFLVGFGGTRTIVLVPALLVFEAVAFVVFIWPAKPFSANPPLTSNSPSRGAPVG